MAKYPGDTLGKRIGRAWFWVCTREALGNRFYTGKHLVLASFEGGDIGVLKAMGVKPCNIIAVEKNAKAAAICASKHPDVLIRVGDVADVVKRKGVFKCLVSAHLDLCACDPLYATELASKVARFGFGDTGYLSIGVSKGHTRSIDQKASELRELLGVDERSDYLTPGRSCSSKNERKKQASRVRNAMKHATVLQVMMEERLGEPGPPMSSSVILGNVVGYSTGTTHMVYVPFACFRGLTEREAKKRSAVWWNEYVAFSEEKKNLDAEQFEEALRAGVFKRVCDSFEAGTEQELSSEDLLLAMQGLRTKTMGYATPVGFLNRHLFAKVADITTCLEPLEVGRGTHATAVTMAEVLVNFGLEPARMLNVSKASLSAWKAHYSRGSYDDDRRALA